MSTLEDLKCKGQFYEFMLLAWGLIEFLSDEGILMAYSLSSQDVRAKPLLDFSFSRKLSLFKNMQILSTKDYYVIEQFRTKRNELFHVGGLYLSSLTDDAKEETMTIGLKAVQIMNSIIPVLNERQSGRYVYLRKEKEKNDSANRSGSDWQKEDF